MNQPLYTLNEDQQALTCHLCGRTTYNLNDVENHYCPGCHLFLDDLGAVQVYQDKLRQDTMRTVSSHKLGIDLAGLEDKWSKSGRKLCAACGFDFDQAEMNGAGDVPLLLWRENGQEMLTLCWECATIRMQNKKGN